jgi:hypothetical protein
MGLIRRFGESMRREISSRDSVPTKKKLENPENYENETYFSFVSNLCSII